MNAGESIWNQAIEAAAVEIDSYEGYAGSHFGTMIRKLKREPGNEPEDVRTFERGLHAAKMACVNELLESPTDTEGDIAYDRAVHHCIQAIDDLYKPQG